MSKEKAKPCLFCDEKKAIYPDRYRDGHWNVHCMICGASGPNHSTEAKAIAAWNTRTPDPRIAALEGALRWIKEHEHARGRHSQAPWSSYQIANEALKGTSDG